MIPGKTFGPADLIAILRRRKWLIVVPFVIVSVGTFIATRYVPNRYRAETLILVVPQRVPESYVKSTVTARIEDRLMNISQQILSRTRLERVILDFNLYEQQRRVGVMEDIVEQMRIRDVEVQVVKGDAFRVSYAGDDPRTVMRVTERLASLFIEENLRDRAVLAEDSYQFLDSQLNDARRRLKEYEKRLEEYRRKNAGQLPTQLESNLQVMQNTQMQIQSLTESMARDRDRRLIVERGIADASVAEASPGPVALPEDPATGTLAQQLEAAQQALRQLQLRLTPGHPDVVRLQRAIAGLTRKMQADAAEPKVARELLPEPVNPAEITRKNKLKELEAELQNIDRQIARKETEEKQLREIVKAYQARVESTPTRESELVELTRDYDTLQKIYTGLLGKKEDSKLAANLEQRQIGEQFKILDPARVPEKPYSPDRVRMNLIGLMFGLGLGCALVTLLEVSDSTFKTDDDVMAALTLPVLAVVPLMVTERDRKGIRRWRLIAATVASSAAAVLVAAAFIIWKLRA